MKTLLKFDANDIVIAQYHTDHEPEPGLFDATGRVDGPDYMGRTYDSRTDTFSAPPDPPTPTRREQLIAKDKSTATIEDIFEAQQELLKSR